MCMIWLVEVDKPFWLVLIPESMGPQPFPIIAKSQFKKAVRISSFLYPPP